jgi:hypothetical protein
MSKVLDKAELVRLSDSPKAQAYLLAELNAARDRLDETTATLQEIIRWRDRIRNRIAYAQLDYDLRLIAAEVRAFKRVCRALAGRA